MFLPQRSLVTLLKKFRFAAINEYTDSDKIRNNLIRLYIQLSQLKKRLEARDLKTASAPLKKIPLPVVWLLPTSGPSDILPPREELILKSPPFILISPFEPLIKLVELPIKNVGVETVTLLPLNRILPLEPLMKLVASPKKNLDELIITFVPSYCNLGPDASPIKICPLPLI